MTQICSFLMQSKIINQELEKISIWLHAYKLSLNIDKTKFMVFAPRQKKLQMLFKTVLNHRDISRDEEVAFLGVILDNHFSWKSHISH